ncbi:right-handed parallel beta-helix repeat-containing protein [Dactylosporangium roseum]|uniref:Right-handed parallel beta-helix repeat-containing protein n=1 Tax=Dactylosporangium roseum TaxID=47989 RepID=A0ABY5ZAM3_9ACTN|nr:right-handed parallel beta-helix repeat-containing protein [Dactylosporangium roseum]UWZ38719.1 right-handed parallel beta-helix repeat-containing protein [Dactylosporangium roseum]
MVDAREHGLAGDGRTNDQPALQRLVDEVGDAVERDGIPRTIHCPAGVYAIQDAGTVWRSGVSLVGDGPAATRFVLSNPGAPTTATPLAFFTTLQHGASTGRCIADVTFAAFEIDGSAITLPSYDVLAKGLGLQYVLRGTFHDLHIHDTPATGFGCDFLQDTTVARVLAEHCGRLDTGWERGGAGIGIGVGGWGDVERLTISDCVTLRNGTNGIFLELQQADWTRPRGIRVLGCHAQGNFYGISDWGADGLVVSGCTMIENHVAGFDVSGQGTTHIAGRYGVVSGCVIDDNVGEGVSIGNTPGGYAVASSRISRNGGHGYRQHNLPGARSLPACDIVIEGNDIWDNGRDGIRIDGSLVDAFLVDNRIRGNGLREGGAGITINARVEGATLRGQRIWDRRDPPTQHSGLRVTARGSLVNTAFSDLDAVATA